MVNTFRGAVVVLAGLAAAGCGTVRAVAPPPVEMPALQVPPVPSRLVEPVPLPPPPPPGPELVPDLPPPSEKPKPAAAAAKPDPKAETPPAEPPAPVTPAPPLRRPGTPDADEATRAIREISRRAQVILANTDYGQLTPEQQAHYQQAQHLINQSEEAIKASNYEFGRNLAEKAERLAKELRGR